jgi:ribosomal protein L30/L7E
VARKIRIQQFKSANGHPSDQARTVRALGIRHLQQIVEHNPMQAMFWLP